MILIPEIHAKRIAPRRFSTQAGKYGFFLLAAFYGSSAIAQPPPGQVFYDVAESSPYFNATTTMYQLGLSVGCDTSPDFCPNNNLLRQDMAVFIVTAWSARMWNNSTAFLTQDPPSSSAYFSDVSSSSPQFPYIQKLYELGVTAGTVAPQINGSTGQVTALGQFSPGGTLTNYQIAVFATVAGALAANQCAAPYFTTLKPFPLSTNTNCTPGYFGSGPSQNPYFSDVVSGNNYFKFVQQLGDSGAVAPPSVPSGYPGCTTCVFGGNNAITRGQMAIWTVVGMGLDPRSVLSMNAVGYGGGPNYYSTLPTVTAAFTYTLHDQEYGESDIQGAQFILADSSGAYHCVGYWADPDYVLYLSDAVPPAQTWGYNILQSDAFCTVSLVSYTPSPTDPSAVTVVLDFTFNPMSSGAYTVISQVNYFSGYVAPFENVGTVTITATPASVTSGTPPGPQSSPTPPPTLTPPGVVTASMQNCDDITGTWTDADSDVYSYAQTGTAVTGTISQYDPYCSSNVLWQVTGQSTGGGSFSLTDYGPSQDACGNTVGPITATVTVNLSSCSAAQVTSAGSSGFNPRFTAPYLPLTTGSTLYWTRTSTPPGIQFTFDLYNNQVTTVLSGPPTQAGNLSVSLSGSQNSPTIMAANNVGPGTLSSIANVTSLPADRYTGVTASWTNSTLSASVPPFTALGTYRFSTYSVPSENACAGSQTPVYVFENNQSCTYSYGVALKSDFLAATLLNGTGSSLGFGLVKPFNTTFLGSKWCSLPPEAAQDGSNTLVMVNSVTGSCNQTLYSGASLATSPNPNPANATWNCSDVVLLMNSSGQANSLRAVQDSCPLCSSQFGTASGHIDTFNTSNQSCNAHSFADLGNFFGIRLR